MITDDDILQDSNHSLKTILQCNEAYNIKFCTNLSHSVSQKPMALFTGSHLLTHKTWGRMSRHRPVYWDDCGVVWILCTTWCSRRAACRKKQYKEYAL